VRAHAIEVCDMVPEPRVREMMGKLVEIIRQLDTSRTARCFPRR